MRIRIRIQEAYLYAGPDPKHWARVGVTKNPASVEGFGLGVEFSFNFGRSNCVLFFYIL